MVRGRALRLGESSRGLTARQRAVSGSDLLAQRVQPNTWAIPADSIWHRTNCQRVADAISIFYWCAWRASILVFRTAVGPVYDRPRGRKQALSAVVDGRYSALGRSL